MKGPFQATLLGLVEVKASLANLNKEARVEVGRACHSLVLVPTNVPIRIPPDFNNLLGSVYPLHKRGLIYITTESMQVLCDGELVTEHKLDNVSTLVAMTQHKGQLVYIGNCRKAKKRLGVAVNLYSDVQANTFVQAYKELKEGGCYENDDGYAHSAQVTRAVSKKMQYSPERATPYNPIRQQETTAYSHPPPPPPPQLVQTQDRRLPPEPNEPRPMSQVLTTKNRPLPPLPSDDPCPELPPKPGSAQPMLPGVPTTGTNDRPFPGKPMYEMSTQPLPRPPLLKNQQEESPPQPQPAITTTTTSKQRPSISDISMSQRPLPPLPTQTSPPSDDPPYHEISTYENEDQVSGVPPQLPPRYANVGEVARERLLLQEERLYDVDDWSDDGNDQDELLYQNTDNYYLSLGIDQEEAEKLYMTTSELDEEEKDRKNYEEEELEPEEETLPETTLEEDIKAFMKDEFNFKNVIWRIREAKPMLTPGLQHFLKGTETLADIHNDMYIELNEGYKSRSSGKIAEVFLSRTDQLERYKHYLLNSPKILRLIQKQPEDIKRLFPKLNQDIQSSWKRLQFYQKSLEKMMDVAPLDQQPALENVLAILKGLNREGDSGIIMEAVKGAPFSVYEYVPLLLHSSFRVRNVGLKDMKSPCHLMLFPKILIITEPTEDGYHYLFHLDLPSLKILPSEHDKERSFILKTKSGGMIGVKSTSEEKLQVWKERINGLIDSSSTTHTTTPTPTTLTPNTITHTATTIRTPNPDNISNIHLKHLGPQGIQALTNIANHSYSHNTIPNIWKHGNIITIPKPNKDPTLPSSHRPITLLCTPSKIIERLIITQITPHIPLASTQHGFRPLHSTNTLLTDLTQRIYDGINSDRPPHRTLLVTLDISKAFDAIPRHNLTNKIYNTNMHNNTKRWLTRRKNSPCYTCWSII
ncbi:hypothetical protein Pcinc_005975 [Petrolisthes cinctipes]|uniref:Reverse transcriptase domain-containing protein n=1 Tax=Petrolisthes cinctipes TaxID=88211 RepID=A0AAE1GDV2_PETCI|nr:hypothetical protein Pcinc_005975 [Petrolisthes cinctipes]